AYDNGVGHSQGLYVSEVNGLLIEGNLFDHNGWNEQNGSGQTIFNHNVYMSGQNWNIVARKNISARASSHGMQARSGGKVEDNVFLANPISLSFGYVNGSTVHVGGVKGYISGNVFLGNAKIGDASRGWAMEIRNT